MKHRILFILILSLSFKLESYYSQVGQDKYLLEHIFKQKKDGFFVDIGAYDGKTHSNTLKFEEIGWQGIAFEPMQPAFDELKNNRACICINACVSNTNGIVNFFSVTGAPAMLSGIVETYDPRHLERLKWEVVRDGGSFIETQMPSRKLNDVLKENNVTRVDYLSLDTEGSELEILQSIDFSKVYIHAMSIENNFSDPAIRAFLQARGFELMTTLANQDEIYVNKIDPELPRLLIKIPTRSRPEQFFEQLKKCYTLLSWKVPIHFHITCDIDDPSMNNPDVIERLQSYPYLTYSFSNNSSKIEAYNRDLDACGDWDIVLALGDDTEPLVQGYDKVIVDTMLTHFPKLDGVLNFHDGTVGADCNTYPIVGNKFVYYKQLKKLFHPSYKSLFANLELTLVSKNLNKEFISDTILFKHNHPAWGISSWDELYIRNENLKEYDQFVFNKRKATNFFIDSTTQPVLKYFCTAADSSYFDTLLITIGSIHATNFEHLGMIFVANLGMTSPQLEQLQQIEKVRILEVEKIHPNIMTWFTVNNFGKTVPGWYAWKPVVIKQVLDTVPYVLWLDATSIVLKPLDDLFNYLHKKGTFFLTIGDEVVNNELMHPLFWGTTQKARNAFQLDLPENSWILSQEFVMGTLFGISREHAPKIITPLYELAKTLDLYEDDGSTPNGFGTGRHDQTLLSILAYKNQIPVLKQDYTQERPICLTTGENCLPFYITWNGAYVDNKTHVYNARGNATAYRNYINKINYKGVH